MRAKERVRSKQHLKTLEQSCRIMVRQAGKAQVDVILGGLVGVVVLKKKS